MRIAYCEDEPAQRSRMELLLRTFAERKRLPLTVEAFSDSAAFLFQYPGSYPFDLIFLDIDLGGMDGMALARKIRETDSEVPILFLTNHKEYVFEGWYREGILLSKEGDRGYTVSAARGAAGDARTGKAASAAFTWRGDAEAVSLRPAFCGIR